jgi:hypothetical protein
LAASAAPTPAAPPVSSGSALGQQVEGAALEAGKDAVSAVADYVLSPSSNSPAALASPILQKFEDALNSAVAAYVTAAIPVPVVNVEVGQMAAHVLALGEQHALTYVSALFQHHQNVAASSSSGG